MDCSQPLYLQHNKHMVKATRKGGREGRREGNPALGPLYGMLSFYAVHLDFHTDTINVIRTLTRDVYLEMHLVWAALLESFPESRINSHVLFWLLARDLHSDLLVAFLKTREWLPAFTVEPRKIRRWGKVGRCLHKCPPANQTPTRHPRVFINDLPFAASQWCHNVGQEAVSLGAKFLETHRLPCPVHSHTHSLHSASLFQQSKSELSGSTGCYQHGSQEAPWLLHGDILGTSSTVPHPCIAWAHVACPHNTCLAPDAGDPCYVTASSCLFLLDLKDSHIWCTKYLQSPIPSKDEFIQFVYYLEEGLLRQLDSLQKG